MLFYAVNLNNCEHRFFFSKFLSRLPCYAFPVVLLELVRALKIHCCIQLFQGAASGAVVQLDLLDCQTLQYLQYTLLRYTALTVEAMCYHNCSLMLAVTATFVCIIWKGYARRWNAGVSMKVCVYQSEEVGRRNIICFKEHTCISHPVNVYVEGQHTPSLVFSAPCTSKKIFVRGHTL